MSDLKLGERLVLFIDKLRGTQEYQVVTTWDHCPKHVAIFPGYKEALDNWNWNIEHNMRYRSMVLQRINKHGAQVPLLSIKW
ncbi:hypothetical protein CHOED_028 [Vibrio phage CHOED]|uniref:hypothetical protein n=1 Tax=Vibrio phage CHOED TaxID=1458716 RepID=UPI00042F1634|nr:hypothetical protein CHOED_028 [Vibrio phage CHOED]AHK11888.1 hypothetical protein CHOED_028 [Vibrio phage CHOED]